MTSIVTRRTSCTNTPTPSDDRAGRSPQGPRLGLTRKPCQNIRLPLVATLCPPTLRPQTSKKIWSRSALNLSLMVHTGIGTSVRVEASEQQGDNDYDLIGRRFLSGNRTSKPDSPGLRANYWRAPLVGLCAVSVNNEPRSASAPLVRIKNGNVSRRHLPTSQGSR